MNGQIGNQILPLICSLFDKTCKIYNELRSLTCALLVGLRVIVAEFHIT